MEATSFDFEAAIRDFAADDKRDSMRLPRLTTGMRKQARVVAEQHAGLRCENLGAGSERRLLLLKERAVAPHPADPRGEAVELAGARGADADEAIDLKAAIEDFIADASRSSWELPRLTAAQRKQARAIVEAYPTLQCESFGMATDRRLHIFKEVEQASGAGNNASRALALSLSLRLPKAEGGEEQRRAGDCSSSASTCASCRGSSAMEPTPLPEGFQVRNTFICGVEAESADTRIVQSMPAGMFRRCLLDELDEKVASARKAPTLAASTTTVERPRPPEEEVPQRRGPPQQPQEDDKFAPGVEVEIQGLTKCPAFNGLQGSVHQLDDETGRYDILLREPAGPSGQRWAKVRAENLRLLELPCPPPSFAPSVHEIVPEASERC